MDKANPQTQTPKPIDANIKIFLSRDKLEASINIESPKDGGKEPDLKAIKSALESKNIRFGINEKLLEEIIDNPVYNRSIVIAKGSKAIAGKDGEYELHFNVKKDLKPKEKEDGTVDFYNLGIVENVKKDQLLCSISPPMDGIDGRTVTGETIPFKPGKPIPHLLGNNTKYNEDNTAVLSRIDGQVSFATGKINVNEVFIISSDVSSNTGNIKALGSVIIYGAVLPGFAVEANGNIEVNGNVTSASLKAGGDILLKGGLIASHIYCEGDLATGFIENSDVFVKGEIKASYIMNSQIKCGKTLKTLGYKSKIVGGRCIAGENIETNNLGSNACVKTYIQIGTDSDSISRQQELLVEIPDLESKMKSLTSLISLLREYKEAGRLIGNKMTTYTDALYSYNEIIKQLVSKKQELEGITNSIRQKGYGRVICRNTTYPGVCIKIGSQQKKINNEMYRKTFYHTNDGISTGNV